MGRGLSDHFGNFHAGHFLEECLRCSGFDITWLASKSGMEEDALVQLFAQSNMDAKLFVKIGRPMGAAFFDRLDEDIFHGKKVQNDIMIT